MWISCTSVHSFLHPSSLEWTSPPLGCPTKPHAATTVLYTSLTVEMCSPCTPLSPSPVSTANRGQALVFEPIPASPLPCATVPATARRPLPSWPAVRHRI